jgi:hypothetical protein
MSRTLSALAALAALAAAPALAQAPAPAPSFVRVAGLVSAVSETSITVKGKDGATTVLALDPAWTVIVTRPVDVEAITPGSFVGTANTDLGGNQGKSIELRIFEPGSHLGEGSRPMAQPNTTMTNGTVTTVSKGASGRELDVQYPGGVRHIVVPPDVQVIGNFPVARDRLKPGLTVAILAVKDPDGVVRGRRISIGEPAAKP